MLQGVRVADEVKTERCVGETGAKIELRESLQSATEGGGHTVDYRGQTMYSNASSLPYLCFLQ